MTKQDQIAQELIAEFIGKNPGLGHKELHAVLRAIEPDRKKLRFGPNVKALLDQGQILTIEVMGAEKYYAASDRQAAKMIRQYDDKDGQPLRILAQFNGAPSFIAKCANPMEWALKNVLTHA